MNALQQTLVDAGLPIEKEVEQRHESNVRSLFRDMMANAKAKERTKKLQEQSYRNVLETLEESPNCFQDLMRLIGGAQTQLERNIIFNLQRATGDELFTWVKKEPDRMPISSPKKVGHLAAYCGIDLLGSTLKFMGLSSYKELKRAIDPDHPSGYRQFGGLMEEELAEYLLSQAIANVMLKLPEGQVFKGRDGLLAHTINTLVGSTLPCETSTAPEKAIWNQDPWDEGEGSSEEDPLEKLLAQEEAWDE